MPSDPLGIMYFVRNPDGKPGIGFAGFRDQSPVLTHNDEWSEILSEILGRHQIPLMLRLCRQSEFFEAVSSADSF